MRRLEVNLPDGSRLVDLLGTLEITMPLDLLLLAVNGRVAEVEQVLKEGDQVNIMPAISGGSDRKFGSDRSYAPFERSVTI